MKRIINTERAPAAVGPYSQAIEAGGVLYVSGQIPVNPATGGMPESIGEQTSQCLANIEAILNEAGYTRGDVVKSTVLLTDMADFTAMNEVYGGFYLQNPPARACFAVRELPKGAKVEIEAIAVK